MLITRETDYAIRILRVLADKERHNVSEFCESDFIPKQFAYKIIKKLSDAGMISSTRGVNGGCELVTDLKDLNLYDVIKVTDPDNVLSECLKPGNECPWKDNNKGHCSVHTHLWQIQKVVDEELKKHNLKDMFNLK